MIKVLLCFLVLFVGIYIGIEMMFKMTGQERWEVAKTFSYSMAIALGVVAFMVCLVVLF
jgi:hypothetical protein